MAESAQYPPLGLLYLAASVRRQDPTAEIRLLDAYDFRNSVDEIKPVIREFRPDILGLTANTWLWGDCLALAQSAKQARPKLHVTMGGYHLSIYPGESIMPPAVDSIVIGEGEDVFPEMIARLAAGHSLEGLAGVWFKHQGQVVRNPPAGRIEDLDRLAFPERELLPTRRRYTFSTDPEVRTTTMLSSRGCPYQCLFCNSFGRYIMRSPENVVAEMAVCRAQGFESINFVDDGFNIDLARTKRLCDRIEEASLGLTWSFRGRVDGMDEELAAKLARAGCRRVNFGMESGSDRVLELIGKRASVAEGRRAVRIVKQAGLSPVGYFIVGFPGETEAEFQATVRLAHESPFDYVQFNTLMIFPKTRLNGLAVEQGVLAADYFDRYLRNPTGRLMIPLWTADRPRAELIRMMRRAYRSFYLRPSYVWARLREVRSWRELRKKARMAIYAFTGA